MKKVKFNIRNAAGTILVRGYTYTEQPDQTQIQQHFDSRGFDWTQYHKDAVSYDIFEIAEAAE
jgi:hypothetical protein